MLCPLLGLTYGTRMERLRRRVLVSPRKGLLLVLEASRGVWLDVNCFLVFAGVPFVCRA